MKRKRRALPLPSKILKGMASSGDMAGGLQPLPVRRGLVQSFPLCTAACAFMLSRVQLFVTPRSVAHRIFQARTLEWVAISSSKGLSSHKDQICISCIPYWQAGSLPLSHLGSPCFIAYLSPKTGLAPRKEQACSSSGTFLG